MIRYLAVALLISSGAYAQQVCDLSLGNCTLLQAIGPQGPAGSGGGTMIPGGRLTLVSGRPIMDSDTTSSVLWYAPYNNDTFPIFNGTSWQSVRFSSAPVDQVGASMAGGSKWTVVPRDIFGTISGTICSGPAWPTSDLGARQLIRYNGILVNSAAIVCDTSASVSVSCAQYQCTYLGSINPSVVGQLTATFSYGQDRKFETWTAYAQNQVDIVLHVGATNVQYMPTNQYPAFAYFGNPPSSLNGGAFFSGLPTNLDVAYYQGMFINSQSGSSGMIAAVCLNGLVNVGFWAKFSSDTTFIAGGAGTDARYNASAMVGLNKLYMCVAKANTPNSTVWGGTPNYAPNYEVNGVMFIRYRG